MAAGAPPVGTVRVMLLLLLSALSGPAVVGLLFFLAWVEQRLDDQPR